MTRGKNGWKPKVVCTGPSSNCESLPCRTKCTIIPGMGRHKRSMTSLAHWTSSKNWSTAQMIPGKPIGPWSRPWLSFSTPDKEIKSHSQHCTRDWNHRLKWQSPFGEEQSSQPPLLAPRSHPINRSNLEKLSIQGFFWSYCIPDTNPSPNNWPEITSMEMTTTPMTWLMGWLGCPTKQKRQAFQFIHSQLRKTTTMRQNNFVPGD